MNKIYFNKFTFFFFFTFSIFSFIIIFFIPFYRNLHLYYLNFLFFYFCKMIRLSLIIIILDHYSFSWIINSFWGYKWTFKLPILFISCPNTFLTFFSIFKFKFLPSKISCKTLLFFYLFWISITSPFKKQKEYISFNKTSLICNKGKLSSKFF